jgi:hypothetical protein
MQIGESRRYRIKKKSDLKVCDNGTLVQILCFWTLSIILPLCKTQSCLYILKHNVSETGFCLRLQVNLLSWAQSIELVPVSIDWAPQSRFYLKTGTESSLRNVVIISERCFR